MYNFYDVIPNKLAINASTKCGSRTVLGYAYLLRNPNADKENPLWFSSRGIYRYTVELGRKIMISHDKFTEDNYPNRVCIVRHPVDRFASAFSNRIRPYKGNEKLSVDEFINLYDSFSYDWAGMPDFSSKNSIYNDIKYHITPLHRRYGKDPSIFTDIFNLGQMNKVKELIEAVSETKLPDLQLNETYEIERPILTTSQKEWICSTFKEDIEIYGKWM
jgi:hypothetical protein